MLMLNFSMTCSNSQYYWVFYIMVTHQFGLLLSMEYYNCNLHFFFSEIHGHLTIGHFRNTAGLIFKTSPGAHPLT